MRFLKKVAYILKNKHFGNGDYADKDYINIIDENSNLRDVLKDIDDTSIILDELKDYGRLKNNLSESKISSWSHISNKINDGNKTQRKITPIFIKRIAVAASFVLFSAGIYQIYKYYSIVDFNLETPQLTEFQPGKNQAVIKLSNGEEIGLKENTSGLSFVDSLHYLNGDSSKINTNQILSSQTITIETPVGGFYHIILPDGTKVWLNALSKISYPNKFNQSVRRVQISGEVYFEVAHNETKPFLVEYDNESVKVLGTRFNINAYKDYVSNYITLLDGAVEFNSKVCKQLLLKPGEQIISEPSRWKVHKVKTEEVVAWKNGDFLFDDTPLKIVMKQLSRWYEFDYDLDEELENVKIWGIISKKTDLSEIFKIIQLTDRSIKIKIEGRRMKILK